MQNRPTFKRDELQPLLSLFLIVGLVVVIAASAPNFRGLGLRQSGPRTAETRPNDLIRCQDNNGSLGIEGLQGCPPPEETSNGRPTLPSIPLLIVVLIAGLLGLGAGLYWLNSARRRTPPLEIENLLAEDQPEPDYTQNIEAINRLLWVFEQEDNPRQAIRKMYATVESGLGEQELASQDHETPLAYFERVMGTLPQAEAPLQELTYLFRIARFSQQEVTEEMKMMAISALNQLRRTYRLAGEKSEAANEGHT